MAKIIGRVVTTPPPKKLSKYENDKKYVTETKLEEVLKDIKADIDLSDIPTEVVVQDAQPSEGTLWINTGEADEIILAEIDDSTVSDEKTWSSAKLSEVISSISGGVSNWNDLIDKPFESEIISDTTLVETQSINLDNVLSSADNVYSTQLNYPLFEIEDGKKYTVTWNGVVYECVSEQVTLMGMSGYMIGNKLLLGYLSGESFNDNEMPFCIGIMDATMIIGDSGTHTINVRYVEENVKQIEAKYIPDIFTTEAEVRTIVEEIINEALDSEV